jgi:hypothetical protein
MGGRADGRRYWLIGIGWNSGGNVHLGLVPHKQQGMYYVQDPRAPAPLSSLRTRVTGAGITGAGRSRGDLEPSSATRCTSRLSLRFFSRYDFVVMFLWALEDGKNDVRVEKWHRNSASQRPTATEPGSG